MATIPLGLYLWRRVKEAGISSIMGVPGDFNLNFLDFIYEVEGLKWVGNANELNAAYAADGYARVKGVPGCLVTTHGVGELSALNGIAGAACEHVPILHIVGQTPRRMQENCMMIHHSIGDYPDHQLYNKTSKNIRCAAAELWDPAKAPAEIDQAIRECFIQKQPAYIFFPIDMTNEQVPANPLETPIELSWPSNKNVEQEAVKAIIDALYESKTPSVFVDALAGSHGKSETRQLVEKLKLPTSAAMMGKSIIDEDHPCYIGLYNGTVSWPGVQKAIEESDLVLSIGSLPADTNTAAFSRKLLPEKTVAINPANVVIKGKTYENVYMAPVLSQLAAAVKEESLPKVRIPAKIAHPASKDADAEEITQSYIWNRIGKFLLPGDVLFADTGTAGYGFPDAVFPKDVTYISQTYYGSIGYSTPSALGAEAALRDLHEEEGLPRGRTVLVTGDGSIQLTIQEVGTMIARGMQPIIMVINNNGYTIERAIHGAKAKYNDIAPYRYSKMLDLFGAKNPDQCYRAARTKKEFEAALAEESLAHPKEVQVLEVHMDALDIPRCLATVLMNRDVKQAEYLRSNGFTNSEKAN